MLFRYSLRELASHPLRTTLAVAGLAVATAMLVDMLMLGRGIERSLGALLRGRGYEIRVSPRGTLPFDTEATIPGLAGLRDTLESSPGVTGVAPVLAANLLLRRTVDEGPHGGGSGPGSGGAETEAGGLRTFALGVDPAEQGIFRLRAGRLPAGSGEAVIGEGLLAVGVSPGDTVRLTAPGGLGAAAGRRVAVVGVADFLYASRDERPLAIRLADLARITGREDRASFLMVRAEEGADPAAVAAAIRRRVPRVEAASAAELVERAGDRLAYFRQLAWILGTVSVVVTALLVGTLMSVSISDRYGMIAALRAIGVSRRSLLRAFGVESLALCAGSGLLGLGLGLVTARYLEAILADFPGLPRAVRFFVVRPEALVMAYGIVVVVGIAAALIPARRAARLEIALTLHREEP